MSGGSILRRQALDAKLKAASAYGTVLLVGPRLHWVLSVSCAVCTILLLGVMFFGSYTRRISLSGELVPIHGFVKIFPRESGILKESNVIEGQSILAGESMFVISAERYSAAGDRTQSLVSESVLRKQASVNAVINTNSRIRFLEKKALQEKIASAQSDIGNIDAQIAMLKERLMLNVEAVKRYEGLTENGYVAKEQLQQKQQDLIDQRLRLKALEIDKSTAERNARSLVEELKNLPLKADNENSDLTRTLDTLSQELTESEAKRQSLIVSPTTGTVTAITAESGQYVSPDRPLASVLPEDASLCAYLYAPSSAIGFVKVGESVQLRYQAYPYQKFGQYTGSVSEISKVALPISDLNAGKTLVGELAAKKDDSVYRVTVKLQRQTVMAYGEEMKLRPGMLLQADVMQERRRIYEWIVEPIYALSGKF